MPERAHGVGSGDRPDRHRAGHLDLVRGTPALQLVEVGAQVRAPPVGVADHRPEAGGLGFERRDLAIDAFEQPAQDDSPLVDIPGRPEALGVADSGRLVLEEEADLREREPGVIAQLADEPQSFQVARVVQAVVALGARGRREEPDLLVVADRARRQAGLRGDLLDPEESWPRGAGCAILTAGAPITGGAGFALAGSRGRHHWRRRRAPPWPPDCRS